MWDDFIYTCVGYKWAFQLREEKNPETQSGNLESLRRKGKLFSHSLTTLSPASPYSTISSFMQV